MNESCTVIAIMTLGANPWGFDPGLALFQQR